MNSNANDDGEHNKFTFKNIQKFLHFFFFIFLPKTKIRKVYKINNRRFNSDKIIHISGSGITVLSVLRASNL